jgi:hypothetical protein
MTSEMKTWPLFLACLLPLAGCVTEDDDPWLARQAGTTTSLSAAAVGGGNRSIPPELAWARLSGIDRKPISARSLSSEDSQVQQVIYPNRTTEPGENRLTVERGRADLDRLRKAPSRAALAAEMRAALPGVAMSTEQVFRTNAYGPYGVATGSLADGSSCVFAWQTIQHWPVVTGKAKEAGTVRLRYCAPGTSKEALANLLATLSLTGGAYGYAAPLAPAVSLAQEPETDSVKTPRRTASSQTHHAEAAVTTGTVSAAASVKARSDAAEKAPAFVSVPLPDG